SFQPMETRVNPSYRGLRSEKWEASPFTAGSSHKNESIYNKKSAVLFFEKSNAANLIELNLTYFN
ncbi:hypothetical protein, partial [Shigella sp. FC1967]